MSLIFASMCVKYKSDLFSLPWEDGVEFMPGPDLHSQVSVQLSQGLGALFSTWISRLTLHYIHMRSSQRKPPGVELADLMH